MLTFADVYVCYCPFFWNVFCAYPYRDGTYHLLPHSSIPRSHVGCSHACDLSTTHCYRAFIYDTYLPETHS